MRYSIRWVLRLLAHISQQSGVDKNVYPTVHRIANTLCVVRSVEKVKSPFHNFSAGSCKEGAKPLDIFRLLG